MEPNRANLVTRSTWCQNPPPSSWSARASAKREMQLLPLTSGSARVSVGSYQTPGSPQRGRLRPIEDRSSRLELEPVGVWSAGSIFSRSDSRAPVAESGFIKLDLGEDILLASGHSRARYRGTRLRGTKWGGA